MTPKEMPAALKEILARPPLKYFYKLTPSERLIIKCIRSHDPLPICAGTILLETACSIHTAVAALLRLRRIGLVTEIKDESATHYTAAPTDEVLQ